MNKIMTLQSFWQLTPKQDLALIPVSGDCMEGQEIYDGDTVAVDLTKMPIPPRYKSRGDADNFHDAVFCYGGKPATLMVKEYCGVWGDMQLVSTRYKWYPDKEFRMNYSFEPLAILGVIYACYAPDGTLRWERDISDRPTELGAEPTIEGDNIGNPRRVIGAG